MPATFPVVTCEKAAVNAFCAHLQAGLGADVQVWPYWPDANVRLTDPQATPGKPRATVTVLLVGRRQDETVVPYKSGERLIHDDVSARIVPNPDVIDVATAVTALNDAVDSYEAHRVDIGAHLAADSTNAVTAPVATNLATGIARVNQLATLVRAHMTSDAHENGDTAVLHLAPVASGDTVAFVAAVLTVIQALNTHYAARIDQWTVACSKQPLQMDLWAGYDTERDRLRARLEPLLRQNTTATTNGWDDDPAQNGCLVAMGDGWQGVADVTFDSPTIIDTPDAAKRKEYRANYTGTMSLALDVMAQSPRLAAATLRARLGASLAAAASAVPKTATLSPGGGLSISGG